MLDVAEVTLIVANKTMPSVGMLCEYKALPTTVTGLEAFVVELFPSAP